MKKRFHNWLFFICLFVAYSSTASSQPIDPRIDKISIIKITVQKLDSMGIAWRTYSFGNGKLMIYEKPFTNSSFKEHLYTIHKYYSREFLKNVNNLRLDTLKENYYNNCVSKFEGKKLIIELEINKKRRNIIVHEYFLTLIDELIKLANNQIPSSFAISYFSPATKQDCP